MSCVMTQIFRLLYNKEIGVSTNVNGTFKGEVYGRFKFLYSRIKQSTRNN